jgi:hypothetical protein
MRRYAGPPLGGVADVLAACAPPCGCAKCRAHRPHPGRALYRQINLLVSRLNERQRGGGGPRRPAPPHGLERVARALRRRPSSRVARPPEFWPTRPGRRHTRRTGRTEPTPGAALHGPIPRAVQRWPFQLPPSRMGRAPAVRERHDDGRDHADHMRTVHRTDLPHTGSTFPLGTLVINVTVLDVQRRRGHAHRAGGLAAGGALRDAQRGRLARRRRRRDRARPRGGRAAPRRSVARGLGRAAPRTPEGACTGWWATGR